MTSLSVERRLLDEDAEEWELELPLLLRDLFETPLFPLTRDLADRTEPVFEECDEETRDLFETPLLPLMRDFDDWAELLLEEDDEEERFETELESSETGALIPNPDRSVISRSAASRRSSSPSTSSALKLSPTSSTSL